MRIVIIGATGHGGTELLKRLQRARSEEGADLALVGVARRQPDQDAAPYHGVEWHTLDISATEDQPAGNRLGRSRRCGSSGVADQPNHDGRCFAVRTGRNIPCGRRRATAGAGHAGARHP